MVSLVLATIGRTEDVERCLRSLVAQTDQHLEVLVVDQNPDDRLLPYITEAYASGLNIRRLRMSKPSLSGARNLGIQEAQGSIIGFPDDDCWYEPEVLYLVRRHLTANPDLGGLIACWVEQSASRGGPCPSGQLSLQQWRNFRGGDASSISLFFRKSLFDELLGFDERLGIGKWFGAGEETDLVLRALGLGAKLEHYPSARVHHSHGRPPHGDTLTQFRNARRRARGTGALYAKHNLGLWVILRGLVAPTFHPTWRLAGITALAVGIATSLGRIEGLLHWQWKHP